MSFTEIFLHLPKTAGNSLRTFLLPNYAEEESFNVAEGLRYLENLERLRTLPAPEKEKLRLVHGHLPYGVHEWLPTTPRYLTMLRHPVDRIMSHYYYVLEQPSHHLYERVRNLGLTLDNYCQSGISGQVSNTITRMLCGWPELDGMRGHGEVTEAAFQAALKNLSTFTVVGIVEDFSRSLALFKQVFGWKEATYERRNVTKQRLGMNDHPPSTIRQIEAGNAYDLQIYDAARRMFLEQCQLHGIPESVSISERPKKAAVPHRSLLRRILGKLKQH